MSPGRISAALLLAVGLTGIASPAGAEDGLDYSGYVEFEQVVAGAADQFWQGVFEDNGVSYTPAPANSVGPGEVAESGCGFSADPDDFPGEDVSPAFYCPVDDALYFASGWMYREAYQRFGDFASVVIVAHEYGHHVQHQIGIIGEDGSVCCDKSVKQIELQADCLSGIFAHYSEQQGYLDEGDVEEGMAAVYDSGDFYYDDPQHHGTPAQRTRWFLTGYDTGNLEECNP